MTAIAPAAVVTGAARLPLPFGLFSVLSLRTGADRWEAGVSFEQLDCGPAGGIGGWDCDPAAPVAGLPKDLGPNGGGFGAATPFVVYGHATCSPIGYSIASANADAQAHLLAREEAAVEHALWTGDLGNVPSLAVGATDLGGPIDTVSGISLLEDFIAEHYGSLGVIHLSRGLALTAIADSAIQANGAGTRLFTNVGTPVVAGAGYPGSGPAAEPPGAGKSWAYASPALFGYRSDVFSPGDPVIDTAQNILTALAERSYLVGFDDCGVAAIEIDTTI
jgi:hypothetical protein